MSFHRVMQSRERKQFQAVGEFIYIEQCPESVTISTERGDYRLKPGAQILDPQLSGRVTVENMGEAGTVSIVCGFGRYIPPTDGQEVTVTEMPVVTLSPNQVVNIGKLPQVALVDGQQVVIAGLPPVEFAENQQVTVSHLPAVSLAAEQQINVSKLPKVQLENGQALRVYATNPLLTKPVGGAGIKTHTLTLKAGATLAANASRCHVLVKPGANNTGPVSLGDGWELAAGEPLKIDTTAELTFTGADGDTIELIEVLR